MKIKGLNIETIVMDLIDMGFHYSYKEEIKSFGYTDSEIEMIVAEMKNK